MPGIARELNSRIKNSMEKKGSKNRDLPYIDIFTCHNRPTFDYWGIYRPHVRVKDRDRAASRATRRDAVQNQRKLFTSPVVPEIRRDRAERVGWNFRMASSPPSPRVHPLPERGIPASFLSLPPDGETRGGGSQTLSGSNDASSGNGEGRVPGPEVPHIRTHTRISHTEPRTRVHHLRTYIYVDIRVSLPATPLPSHK